MAKETLCLPDQVSQILSEIGGEIYDEFKGDKFPIVVGIQSGGMRVARCLEEVFLEMGVERVVVGSVDTTLYRDDIHRLLPSKGLLPMELPVSIEDEAILLVDDVIFTGRSARAAMDALFCLGRPRLVRLAVLVDRGHRELPIQPDYCGFVVETSYRDTVEVMWGDLGGEIIVVRENGV